MGKIVNANNNYMIKDDFKIKQIRGYLTRIGDKISMIVRNMKRKTFRRRQKMWTNKYNKYLPLYLNAQKKLVEEQSKMIYFDFDINRHEDRQEQMDRLVEKYCASQIVTIDINVKPQPVEAFGEVCDYV